MPIYEYECEKCGEVFEEWQKDFKDREVKCPKCNSPARRLISHTSFILKGSGWYVTDYGRSSTGGNGGGNGNGKKDSSSKTKTESASTTSTTTAASSKTT